MTAPVRPTTGPSSAGDDDRPPPDVEITASLVRHLLATQHPDLADLPLRHADGGWDNEMWRLGDDLAVRLPRRTFGATAAEHEQHWVPELARRLSLAVPLPLRVGRPDADYPYPWTVVRWVAGTPAWQQAVPARSGWAPHLADALADLHVPAPPDAPVNPFRGGPLAGRDEAVRERLAAVGSGPDRLLRQWADAVDAPTWGGPPLWIHGDPHPANLVVRGGVLAGLVDFSDLTAGDPATDLATAWLTFDAAGRAAFLARLQARGAVDPDTWRRARGWALSMASTMAARPPGGPIHGIGRHALAALVEESGGGSAT